MVGVESVTSRLLASYSKNKGSHRFAKVARKVCLEQTIVQIKEGYRVRTDSGHVNADTQGPRLLLKSSFYRVQEGFNS